MTPTETPAPTGITTVQYAEHISGVSDQLLVVALVFAVLAVFTLGFVVVRAVW